LVQVADRGSEHYDIARGIAASKDDSLHTLKKHHLPPDRSRREVLQFYFPPLIRVLGDSLMSRG
jgi:hypothetical protein